MAAQPPHGAMRNDGFLEPTIGNYDGLHIIESPDELFASIVVTHVRAEVCGNRPPGHGQVRCGLVRSHHGACWAMADELVDEDGAFAVCNPPVPPMRSEQPWN
jgi:hypothetical protein